MKSKDDKKIKKIIVNGLTLSRAVSALILPFLYSYLSVPVFLILVASILFTDCVDGFLAKKCWKVSTIFGSLADMGADKLFGFSILSILSTMYPIMCIPLLLEVSIFFTNSISASHGAVAKSSEIGRFKTLIVGISVCLLFITGLNTELITSLESLKVSDFGMTIYNNIKPILDKIIANKSVVESAATTATITSEAVVLSDYLIKSIKQANKSDKIYKMAEYLKNKEYLSYIKKVLFDEKYYQETKDMSLYEKLTPPESREDVKIKKLTLDSDKK